MICQEFEVSKAKGVSLFYPISTKQGVLPKGHVLSEADLVFLKQVGIHQVFGAVLEDSDLSFVTALRIIAAKLCGANTGYSVNEQGICKIIAMNEGVFLGEEHRIVKFNRHTHNIILNTIAPYSKVKTGEVVAELELTSSMISQEKIDDIIFKLSGNVDMLEVSPLKTRKAALIYSKFYDNVAETKHFMEVLKKFVRDLSDLKIDFTNEYNAEHNIGGLTNMIDRAIRDGNELVFVLSGVRSYYEKDILPESLRQIVDEFVNVSLPQIGASDLFIAQKRHSKIICLPNAYDEVDTTLINRYIKQAIFADKLHTADFVRHQNISLDKGLSLSRVEKENLIASDKKASKGTNATVGAVILAAGKGSRAGRDKLLVGVDGEPLFMKSVNAALRSKASPVFIVTGHRAEEMEEYLENIDINIIYNPSFYAGIKTSLSLGLKSMPSFCDGAVIIPADMPNLQAQDIDDLIDSFDENKEKELCMFTHEGIKSNPILWSKSLYDVADIVPENAHLRPIFVEHADYTKLVEIDDSNKLLDVNFPSDVDKVADK